MDVTFGTSSSRLLQNGIPARYILAILSFFGFLLNYMLRVNMSIALVVMVKRNDSRFRDAENEEGEFYWDDTAISLITGAFFWGYIFTQVPGGRIAEMIGAKYIFGFSIFCSGVVTLAIPFAAEENPLKIICLRTLLGLFEGTTYPSMHVLLAKWAPPSERSRITAIVYSGAQAGTVLTMPLVGETISIFGWRPSFYIMAALPAIWMVFWVIFVFDTPQSHPRIGTNELKYLEDSIPATPINTQKTVPWVKILTSPPFYAIIVSGVSCSWGFWTLLTFLPTYMKTMLHFDIKQNSLLSSIPYLAMWMFALIYAVIADRLRSCGSLNTTNVRKFSTVICLGFPALALFAVTFVGTDPLATLILFTFGVGMTGAKYSAYLSNHMDISPNYAGTLLGIANAVNTIPGWLSPLVTSAVIANHHTLSKWHEIFYIASGFYAVGCGYYLLFGSAEIQEWNNSSETKSRSESCSSS